MAFYPLIIFVTSNWCQNVINITSLPHRTLVRIKLYIECLTGMPYTLQTCCYIIITIILWPRKYDVSSVPAWRCIPDAHFHCLSPNCLPGHSLAMFTSLTSFLLLHPDFSGFSGHLIEIRDRYLDH